MMDDTISRQAALKAVSFDTEAYMAVNMLPSAQQWIPCSERLPEEGKEVLISTKCYSLYLGVLEFVDDLVRWYDTQEYIELKGVTAWMPLPEPYKQEENR